MMPDGRSIEQWYQCDVKGYDVGGTNWRLGKGKQPLNNRKNLWELYLRLWKIWAKRNPDLMVELRQKFHEHGRLSDRFASTPINQAHALATILTETTELDFE